MDNPFVVIAVAENKAKGEIFRHLLEKAGLQVSLTEGSLMDFCDDFAPPNTSVSVLVPETDVEKALALLKSAETQPEERSFLSSSDKVSFRCRHCAVIVTASRDLGGRHISCPTCNGDIEVPQV